MRQRQHRRAAPAPRWRATCGWRASREQLLDCGAELVRVEWLRDKAVGAGDLHLDLRVAPGGYDDDGDLLERVSRAQLLEHLDPAQAGQHHVEHDQVRSVLTGE